MVSVSRKIEMRLKMYQVDAFALEVFSGSPAAVIPLEDWLPVSKMQAIAIENSLPETAFFVRNRHGHYEIRWFSPLKEIDFCGHATLASAYVLFEHMGASHDVTFWAQAVGEIPVSRLDTGEIELNFPDRSPSPLPLADVPAELTKGLSIAPQEYWINQQAYFAVYATQQQVEDVVPHLEFLKTLGPRDVVVTALGSSHDFVSRYFWPANGGEEDPVTGSIHAGLAPFWAHRLGKNQLMALQASQRSGVLKCRIEAGRVLVAGSAVLYLEGVITI
jgi:PhzF family phenazine biosynthesis protein